MQEQWSQAGAHRLLLVGFEITQRTEALLKRVSGAVRLDDAPWMFDPPPPALKNARVAFIDAQRFDHRGLITAGRVVPWVLRNWVP